ncbi:hypothetical protein Sjap_014210 [Stephania japonica]|uniref:40S ribosomal protein S4 n=1 Tax=Stephania japonica TaxID=461633 RepID=A0AAP0J180_9MAGN
MIEEIENQCDEHSLGRDFHSAQASSSMGAQLLVVAHPTREAKNLHSRRVRLANGEVCVDADAVAAEEEVRARAVEARRTTPPLPTWSVRSSIQSLTLSIACSETCVPGFDSLFARGLKKHLKRLNAPKHWMLDKLGGAFAPKPSSGPHKSRECLPLILILRNRLKYALTYREVIAILMQRHVMVDAKVRTDKTYPAGFMDVVSIPKTNENFRLLYDTKGRFRLHSIRDEEAKFKLCKVRSIQFGQKGIPYLNTYDGRTIRYPDPLIKANDTIKLDLESNKITDFIKFDVGNVVMVTGGRNRGRVGVIKNREKHKGSFETVHIQDATGHEFATRLGNVFTIGKGTKPWVTLPKGKGIKLSIIEEARKRLAAQGAVPA